MQSTAPRVAVDAERWTDATALRTFSTDVMNEIDRGYAVGHGTLALIHAGLTQGNGYGRPVWFPISLFMSSIATFGPVDFMDVKRLPAGGIA